MIRPGRQPRPDSCCVSSDVLTGPEVAFQHANRHLNQVSRLETGRETPSGTTWADYPHIADVLNSLRSNL